MASGAGHSSRQTQPQGPSSAVLSLWKQRVEEWYPDLYHQPYFIPPVYMYRTQHQAIQLSGRTVFMTQPSVTDLPRGAPPALQESDVRDDVCQQKVLECLHRLSQTQTEGMFVLSQLNFGHYLNDPSFAAAASTLARPEDLKAENKHRGDFDVLIIHRRHGILVGEIKAIGDTISSLPQQQQDQQVTKKVEQAIKQLHKAEDVLKHLTDYLQPPPRVQKTLMLPNITRAQLQRVLGDNPQLTQDLGHCLGMAGSVDPSALCMTSDDVIRPVQWWQQRVTGSGTDPAMTDPVYLDLVSRFCGPATTVTVHCSSTPRLALAQHSDLRTSGDGVGETAARFAPVDIVLHPTQVAVLNSKQPLVYINGPPGTGKTLMLILKALDLLEQNKPVQVVSARGSGSLAASTMIYKQLQQTAGPTAQQLLHLHTFDIDQGDDEVERAVKTLRSAAVGGQLYVIIDESTIFVP
ncbi:uncharacterized protein [Littorina saxatilis]|uniref:uncharacterized protein isoform X1 n=1 Tax=Littorina saxatilis TaxID=31220 RepID=UPI0038B47176